MLLVSLCVFIGGLIAACIYFLKKQNDFLIKSKDIPLLDGIQHYPIIGFGFKILTKSTDEIYNDFLSFTMATSASVFKLYIFNKLFIVVKNPDHVSKILSSPQFAEKASPYSILPYQNSLFTSKGVMWKSHRKMLNTSFHITLIHKRFIQQFNDAAKFLVRDLKCKVGVNQFDIEPLISLRSSDLQLKSIFDTDIGNDDLRTFTDNSKEILQLMADLMFQKVKLILLSIISYFIKVDQLYGRVINKNLKYIQSSIGNARKQYSEKMKFETQSEENMKVKPEIVIHKLVSMLEEGYVTEQTAKDHINFLLIAGADTMNVAVSNCILCLAMNVDAQDKCANEIKQVIGDKFNTINIEDLTKLELLDRTINESLRLIPPIPAVARLCAEDYQLDDNKIIPAGTDVIIPILAIHRCKEYWGNNPTKFNPDNFLPENVAKRPRQSYLPFSYGSRNCIAKKYAQYALKIYMAHLLAKYKFSTDLKFEELEFGFHITTVLKNNYMVRVDKR